MWCRLSTDISERTEVYYVRRFGGGILVTLAEDEYAKQKERINDNTS